MSIISFISIETQISMLRVNHSRVRVKYPSVRRRHIATSAMTRDAASGEEIWTDSTACITG